MFYVLGAYVIGAVRGAVIAVRGAVIASGVFNVSLK